MRNIPRTVGWPMIFGVAVLIGVVVAPSFALRSAAPPNPSVICHIDLSTVFDRCQWRADALVELANLQADRDKEIETQSELVKELEADMELFQPGTPQYKQKEAELIDAVVRLKALIDFFDAKGDVRRAALRSEIYQKIVTAVAVYARQNGIDYVITDDSKVQMAPVNEVQVVQQMALQRVVYANPDYDVTTDLLAWINR